MSTLDDVKQFWQQNKDNEPAALTSLNKEEMKKIIQPKIKKEQSYFKEYILAFAFWQVLVYAALCHFIIHYWGDWDFMRWCAIGILVFIPYTVTFHKNFICIKLRALTLPDAPLHNIYNDLKIQISQVTHYFNFKKKFDFIGMPVISFVIMAILLKVSPIPHTLTSEIITFGIILIVFSKATYVQNKNNFKFPLHQLQLILRDIENIDE
jgi:hypothetical protein